MSYYVVGYYPARAPAPREVGTYFGPMPLPAAITRLRKEKWLNDSLTWTLTREKPRPRASRAVD